MPATRFRFAIPQLAGILGGLLALLFSPTVFGQPLPAFPGAQGFGAIATGGRGGAVHKVTTLAASGPGSLQWALDQPGPRIIVFAVSGVIEGDVQIPHGDVTVAGQTAPGAGITIHGHLYTPFGDPFGNIILRHLRVRPPDPDADWPASQHDAIQFSTNHTLMLDHIDASHGADETIDLWNGATDVTLQWSAITYPIYDPANGWTHNKGILNHRPCLDGGTCDGGDPPGGRISIHHNLFAHARNRTPALSIGPAEVVNNVTYNGREGFVHHNIATGDFNLVGNVYIQGPDISLAPFWFDPENGTPSIPTRYWLWDGLVEDPGDFVGRVDNPYTTPGFSDAYAFACCGIVAGQFNAVGPFDFSGFPGYVPIETHPAAETEARILERVGAFPRDIVNRWAVADVATRTGAWGNRRPADWLDGLTPGAPPPDLDDDGMADRWEVRRGLDPTDSSDHSTVMPSGYTAIEEYINGLADGFFLQPIFVDDFVSGDLSEWFRFEGPPGALAVNGAAAFAGDYGLQVTLASSCTDPGTLALADGSESGIATFRACEEVQAESFTLTASADVTFEAGRAIVLGNGFSVAPGARFEARIDPTLDPSAYVEDRSPDGEPVYHARFYLRLDGASLGGGRFDHFTAYDADGMPQLRLVLLRNATIQPPENRLILEARRDDGTFATTEGVNEAPLSDSWQAVEIAWSAAAPGLDDGSLHLWLDGVAYGGLENLDNDQGRIDRVRWGAVSGLDPETTGALHLDELVSRRAGPIGLLE